MTPGCCAARKAAAEKAKAAAAEENKDCMEIVTLETQPTTVAMASVDLPTPAEIVPLMAMLGICLGDWLLDEQQPMLENTETDHFIVPARGILCHNCTLLC